MTIDERFNPRDMAIPFDAAVRHFQRYLTAVKLLGRWGKDELWLDASCGTGYGTQLLGEFCCCATGVDVSDKAIEQACLRCSHASYWGYDSFPLWWVNVIFSIETIEHITDQALPGFFAFIDKHLLRGGDLIVCTPIVEKHDNNPTNPHHVCEYDKDSIQSLLNENGFNILSSMYEPVVTTDGEKKEQGYFHCKRA